MMIYSLGRVEAYQPSTFYRSPGARRALLFFIKKKEKKREKNKRMEKKGVEEEKRIDVEGA